MASVNGIPVSIVCSCCSWRRSWPLNVGIALAVLLGVGKLVVGANNTRSCTLENNAPVFILGSLMAPVIYLVFVKVVQFRRGHEIPAQQGKADHRESEDATRSGKIICGILAIANIAWQMAGTRWVYSVYQTVWVDGSVPCTADNKPAGCTDGKCDEIFVKIACAFISIDWICLVFCCVYLLYVVCKRCNIVCTVSTEANEDVQVVGVSTGAIQQTCVQVGEEIVKDAGAFVGEVLEGKK
ncbi:uncharacterized protein LOC123540995 [Mercenaria mercenaria]|uniref:uncharacterized protein LOC123540995 n=1 Tax=Mercenaria mercenaria TaxID=6596 RepID=UPI00234E60DA|nr:uncharacterized protein LOC123540995 [Mercenaria mercenaria]